MKKIKHTQQTCGTRDSRTGLSTESLTSFGCRKGKGMLCVRREKKGRRESEGQANLASGGEEQHQKLVHPLLYLTQTDVSSSTSHLVLSPKTPTVRDPGILSSGLSVHPMQSFLRHQQLVQRRRECIIIVIIICCLTQVQPEKRQDLLSRP